MSFNCNNSNNKRINHIIIRGKPYERGLSYGQQMRDKINANLNFYKRLFKFIDWFKVHEVVDQYYVKAIEHYYPSGLLEMKGMAIGAQVMIEDIIALNCVYELVMWDVMAKKGRVDERLKLPPECVSAVCLSSATESGAVLMGMSWDAHEYFLRENMTVLLEVYPSADENIAPFFMFTEVGGMGRIGMNANGMGITGLSIFSNEDLLGDNKGGKAYFPSSLLRRVYIEAPNMTVGLKRLLSPPRHVSTNITVASGVDDEALNIEMSPNDSFLTYPAIDAQYLTHTNRFKSQGFIANPSLKDKILGEDLIKDRQMQQWLHYRCKSGSVTSEYFANGFKNHVGFPNSVCFHLPPDDRWDTCVLPALKLNTTANVLMDLTTKTLRVCSGQPCVGTYSEHTFTQ